MNGIMHTASTDRSVTDLMTGLSRRRRRQVMSQMTHTAVGPDTTLTVKGEPGRQFYLLTEGRVQVSVDGETVAEVEAGDFFGEIALLGFGRRTATVKTADGVEVEVMNRREFASVLDLWPSLAKTVTSRATSRLHQLGH